MADNILKGIIRIEAPGVEQTANKVAAAVNKTEQSFKKLTPASNQATSAMINLGRVVQDAPFGFLGIANNLNPLLESFQRLKESTGSTGSALKALGGSLLGAGGLGFAISIVSSALILFGDKIFGAGKRIKDAEVEAAKFAIALQNIKKGIDAFQNFNQFNNALDKLKLKLQFGSGAKAEQLGLGLDVKSDEETIERNGKRIDELIEKISVLRQKITVFNFETGKVGSSSAKKLLDNFLPAEIPEDQIDKLSKSEQKVLREIKKFGVEKKALEDQRAEASKSSQQKELEIQVIGNEEAKRLRDKALAEARAAAERWRRLIDSMQERVGKGILLREGLNLFSPSVLKVDVSDLTKINAQLESVQTKIQNLQDVQSITGINAEEELKKYKEIEEQLKKIAIAFPQQSTVNDPKPKKKKELTDEEEGWLSQARAISEHLTPALQDMASAIGRGENAFKAFGKAVQQILASVIQQLIQTAILAGILSLISGGASGGGVGFFKAFGSILGGGSGFGGSSFIGGGGMQIQGTLIGRGNDLIGVISNQGRSNLRVL
jgi:hypothetical protein